ncbi:MAG: OmpA family protein [Candidatus Azobacteroides sp.]|nr:OmpA family protein [Candidatus Azobacteroides sp.]
MKYSGKSLLILIASVMFTGCVSSGKFNRLQADYDQMRTNFQDSQMQLVRCNTNVKGLDDRLAEAQRNNDDLRASLANMQNSLDKSLAHGAQSNQNIGKLVDEINASNRFIQHLVQAKNQSDSLNLVMVTNLTRSLTREEAQDLDIQVLKGVVYISLADNMLFDSGSFEVRNQAGEILSKIARIILDYRDYTVLVEGNTDDVPISRANIRNNWDLSVLRGSSVVQALQTNYGVDPRRLTAGGRGEYNPVATNNTPDGRSRNRRTQIIVTPELNQFMELIEQAPPAANSPNTL